MKWFAFFLIIISVAALAAIITKPSDEQCVELIKSKINTTIAAESSDPLISGLGSVLVDLGVKKVMFRIEDKIFYKDIYLIVGDKPIGTAMLGTVFIHSN